MKSSAKFSIALVLSISLLFSCSLLLWNAQAEVTLQKVSLENNLIRIQTSIGNPVIDIQLLENTDYCLTDCHAILKIHPYQDIVLPSQSNSEFAWNFVKEKPWMDGLVSYHFEILETTEYNVDVPDYGKVLVNTTCYDKDNSTYQCKVEETIQTGSHEETRYSNEYRPFAFWGEKLESGNDYTIKLAGKKRLQFGTNNVEWIPTIKGFELSEWDWWNTSYIYRYRIISNASVNSFLIAVINGTTSFAGNTLWTNNKTVMYVYCENSGCGSGKVAIANETGQLNWQNGTSRTGNNPTSVWNDTLYSWNFDEGSGTTAYDNTARGKNLTQYSGSIGWSDAIFKYGTTIKFNGSDGTDMMSVSGMTFPNASGTYMFWAYPTLWGCGGDSTFSNILSHGISGENWNQIRFERGSEAGSNDRISVYYGDGSGYELINSTTALNDNTWYHIVFSWDASNKVNLYINGLLETNKTATYPPRNTRTVLYLGAGWSTSRAYCGYLDDLRIYNRTLSAQEIKEIYWNGINNLTSLGPEETVCPSDDTYVNENKEYEPAFCNIEDDGMTGVLIINASNIILDCNGMTLNGNGSGIGVENNGFDNVTIKNCAVQNYWAGIKYDWWTENGTLYNNTLASNAEAGVKLNISIGNNISNNKIYSNGRGIILFNGAFKNVFVDNNISDNTYKGVYLDNCIGEEIESNNTFINNVIKSNGEHDVYILIDEYAFFINTTYDTEYVQAGNLTRQWYLKVNVTTKNMTAIQNAQVTIKDKFNTTEWTQNTSADGLTGWNVVTQYVNKSGTTTYYTPHTIQAFQPSYPTNSTTQNITESKVIHVILKNWEITFNVTSGETGSPIQDLDNIVCNYSGFTFNASDDENPYGPYEFPPGSWWCRLEDWGYYNKSIVFSANNDTTIDAILSEKKSLTIEEHNWLESIYNCLINKDCDVYDLWNQTYEYASNIWDQFKQTDESVVVLENITNKTVSNTSNLTIEYLIDVPVKENYQFLPIRIFYWFMDENNEICYNQAKEGNNAENPFCNPLVAQTIGEVNTQINFTVDLRPSLPEGNYTVVRRIDIDPENMWINYGHETIGTLEVTESSGGPEIKLSMNGNLIKHETQEPVIKSATETEQSAGDKTTGMITAQQIDNVSYVAVIVSVITLALVSLMYKNSRKRSPWGN